MTRQSVLAYRFTVEGAIPFDPADLDDFNRANVHLKAVEAALKPYGGHLASAKVTTRQAPPEPGSSILEINKRPSDEPIEVIPAILDRTKGGTS